MAGQRVKQGHAAVERGQIGPFQAGANSSKRGAQAVVRPIRGLTEAEILHRADPPISIDFLVIRSSGGRGSCMRLERPDWGTRLRRGSRRSC
jgi:hypothetical protein